MTTGTNHTDDPRMGEFDRLLSGYTNGLFAAGDPEDWFTTDDLRSWVAANLVPAPAGERAELVKRLREEARTWRELIEEEAVGNRLDKPVFYFERMIALIEHAADALEAQLSKIPGEFETRLAALEARHARLGAEVGDEIRALRHRVGELEDRVERLGDDSQEHHDRLWTTEDALAARETPIRETQPAERLTGDPQNDGHGHSHEHT